MIPAEGGQRGDSPMMGRQDRDQRQLFYEFSFDEVIPADHLLRRINVFATTVLTDLHEQLKPFYSDIGRPSIDPELMIRMLLVGYCYGIRHERRLCHTAPCLPLVMQARPRRPGSAPFDVLGESAWPLPR